MTVVAYWELRYPGGTTGRVTPLSALRKRLPEALLRDIRSTSRDDIEAKFGQYGLDLLDLVFKLDGSAADLYGN